MWDFINTNMLYNIGSNDYHNGHWIVWTYENGKIIYGYPKEQGNI